MFQFLFYFYMEAANDCVKPCSCGVRFLLFASWCWFLCSQTWGVISKGFVCRKTRGSGLEVKHTQILSTCKNSIAPKWGYCIAKMHCLRLRNTEKWVNCSLFLIYCLNIEEVLLCSCMYVVGFSREAVILLYAVWSRIIWQTGATGFTENSRTVWQQA